MDAAAPHFAEPLALLLAPPLALTLVLLHVHAGRARARALARFASAPDLARLVTGADATRRHVKFALTATAALALVLALARPHWGLRPGDTPYTPEDVMLVVDTSRSMDAADAPPSRLGLAKRRLALFLAKHRQGRVGLTAFGRAAITLCPPTDDRAALEEALRHLDTGRTAGDGTDLAAALREAALAFGHDRGHRTLLLVSDGEDLGAQGAAAAATLAGQGVVVHTMAVGTPAGTAVNTAVGAQLTRADEDTLGAIARATGGLALPGDLTPADLDRLVARLRVDATADAAAPQGVDRSPLLIALALILVATERFLGTRRRGAPRGVGAIPCLLPLVLLPAMTPQTARADDATLSPSDHLREGLRLLKTGAPASAEAHLKEALTEAPPALRPVALHNLGVARARRALALIDKTATAPDARALTGMKTQLDELRARLAGPDGACDETRRKESFYAINRQLVTGADAVKRGRERLVTRRDALPLLRRAAEDFAATAELEPDNAAEAACAAETRDGAARLARSIEADTAARDALNRALDDFHRWARMSPPAAGANDPGDEDDGATPPMSEAEARALLESIRDQLNNTLPAPADRKPGGRDDGNHR